VNDVIDSCPPPQLGPAVTSSITSRLGQYEVKVLLSQERAVEILERARRELAPDPHAATGLGDGYVVNSLYFDTDDLAVFHGLLGNQRSKFRLRRYGDEAVVYLERKSKHHGLVDKERCAVRDEELWLINQPGLEQSGLKQDWSGAWFQDQLQERQQSPKCQVRYERVARIGNSTEGPIRLTIDRAFRCCRTAGLNFSTLDNGISFLEEYCIVEFKFSVALPDLFKRWFRELQLTPSSVSKYRLGMVASGQ